MAFRLSCTHRHTHTISTRMRMRTTNSTKQFHRRMSAEQQSPNATTGTCAVPTALPTDGSSDPNTCASIISTSSPVQEPCEELETISDSTELCRHGICKVAMPTDKVSSDDWLSWANTLSQVTPEILAGQGDSEYVFYRNILEEEDFPFDAILNSSIGEKIVEHFPIESLDEIRIDDAFCIQYNEDLADSSGGRHLDPSDITVNICLERTPDTRGSHVLFHGTKPLVGVDHLQDTEKKFLVEQEQGYATIHWGDHPHETTRLESGKRTNIVLTYWYKDSSRSDVATRCCYG
jgi:hypothetical protein